MDLNVGNAGTGTNAPKGKTLKLFVRRSRATSITDLKIADSTTVISGLVPAVEILRTCTFSELLTSSGTTGDSTDTVTDGRTAKEQNPSPLVRIAVRCCPFDILTRSENDRAICSAGCI